MSNTTTPRPLSIDDSEELEKRRLLDLVRASKQPAYARRLEDLKRASAQLGDTPARRLAWIVKFAVGDRTVWQTGHAGVGNCLLALTHGPYPQWWSPPTLPPPLDREVVNEARAAVYDLLRELVTVPFGTPVRVPTAGVRDYLIRYSDVSKKPAIFAATYSAKDARRAVIRQVRDLVFRAGHRLIACQRCRAPVVAVRKQEFCNERCAQEARNYRKKLKPQGRSEP